MQKRLEDSFKNRKALIAYVTAGDPSLSVTEKLVCQLEKAGADIVELGIPFSDPLADGPVIQASHQRALKKNASLSSVFRLASKLTEKVSIPICFMLSYNLVVQYGEEKFYRDCETFGVSGVIIPDLPAEQLPPFAKSGSVANIFLAAPTSTDKRLKLIAESSTGFVYLVSVAGITGVRQNVASGLGELVKKIRSYSRLPIAIGFGISNPKQAAEMAKIADGVIVGSAIVDLVAKKKSGRAVRLVATIRKALDAR